MQSLETNRRCARLQAEALWVTQNLHIKINFDKIAGTWFHVQVLSIPPGWNYSTVDILIDIPHGTPGYPQISPESIWTNRDLATTDGRSIDSFPGVTQLVDQKAWSKGWRQISIHITKWQSLSGVAFERGDNLLSYLQSIIRFFDDYQQKKAE